MEITGQGQKNRRIVQADTEVCTDGSTKIFLCCQRDPWNKLPDDLKVGNQQETRKGEDEKSFKKVRRTDPDLSLMGMQRDL
jgi:hypothetical protein